MGRGRVCLQCVWVGLLLLVGEAGGRAVQEGQGGWGGVGYACSVCG